MTEDDFDVQYVERDDRSARVLIRGLTPGVRERHPPRDDRRRPDVLDRHRQVRREPPSVMFDEMIGLRLGLIP